MSTYIAVGSETILFGICTGDKKHAIDGKTLAPKVTSSEQTRFKGDAGNKVRRLNGSFSKSQGLSEK